MPGEPVYTDESAFPKLKARQADPWDYEVSYINLVLWTYWHAAGIYGGYLCLTAAAWPTVIYSYIFYIFSILGVTAGAHRLWSHRSYKVKLPLQIILMLFHTLSGQYTVYNWVRDHRLHHRHAAVLFTMVCYVIPTLIPMLLWGETLNNAYHVNLFRFITSLNFIALLNSAAHKFGYRPYDKSIVPTDNEMVKVFTLGDGAHNFHHTFPWDYRSAEFGDQTVNLTRKFIEFFAWIGWAYDLKTVDDDIITKRALRNGDGSRLTECNIKLLCCFKIHHRFNASMRILKRLRG